MKTGLYIDMDTTSVDCIKAVCDEVQRTCDIAVRKAYGIAGDDETCRQALHACRVTREAAWTDSSEQSAMAMATDIISDFLMTGVESVYVMSENESFIPVIDRLRADGAHIVGFGSCETPEMLVAGYDSFVYTDVLMGRPCTAKLTPIEKVTGEIYAVTSYYKGVGRETTLEQVYEGVKRKYPQFDVRNYGYSHFETFVRENATGVFVYTDAAGRIGMDVVDSREELEKFIYAYMAERGYKIDDMSELLAAVTEKFPGFAMTNYGYHTDYGFILSFPRLEIEGNKGVKLKRSFRIVLEGQPAQADTTEKDGMKS